MKFWIARDEDGYLSLFRDKPIIFNSKWRNGYAYGTHCFRLPSGLFPEVTFENSPQEVELKFINQ